MQERNWNIWRGCAYAYDPAYKWGGQSDSYVFSAIDATMCKRTSWLFHCKIRHLRSGEVFSDFTLQQALMRHLAAFQSSNFAVGKPWCLRTQCRVNWTEHITACISPSFLHGCPRVRITMLNIPIAFFDAWLCKPKAAYLNINRLHFFNVL